MCKFFDKFNILLYEGRYPSPGVPHGQAAAGARGRHGRDGGGAGVVAALVRRVHGQLAAQHQPPRPRRARLCDNIDKDCY